MIFVIELSMSVVVVRVTPRLVVLTVLVVVVIFLLTVVIDLFVVALGYIIAAVVATTLRITSGDSNTTSSRYNSHRIGNSSNSRTNARCSGSGICRK